MVYEYDVLIAEREGAIYHQPRAALRDQEAMRILQAVGVADTATLSRGLAAPGRALA